MSDQKQESSNVEKDKEGFAMPPKIHTLKSKITKDDKEETSNKRIDLSKGYGLIENKAKLQKQTITSSSNTVEKSSQPKQNSQNTNNNNNDNFENKKPEILEKPKGIIYLFYFIVMLFF
jgi:hypothetical protein